MYLHRESDILASGKLVSLINSCEFLPKNLNFLKFLNLAFIIFLTSCWCYSLIPAKSPTLNCPLQLVTSTCLYLKLLFCCFNLSYSTIQVLPKYLLFLQMKLFLLTRRKASALTFESKWLPLVSLQSCPISSPILFFANM